MPASGPVYQPTTVTYEQQSDWTPVSYLSQTVNNGVNRTKCLQWFLLVLGLFCLAAGLIMLVEGAVDYSSPSKNEEDETGTAGELAIAISGGVLTVIGVCLLVLYIRMARRRKGCPCFPSKEQRLARQLDNQVGNGQYGPVSEISYQPPAVSEEEETRKLMGSDNKECNEESERMLEPDPRIVLRPRSHVEEA
ncbi:uncharacterized protein [Anabrus simplex]|uniref:uncharacterized protein isoform X2 n=1 Tax=Anabrus simplex TaxID=316456 RepID=UPI0034DD20A2